MKSERFTARFYNLFALGAISRAMQENPRFRAVPTQANHEGAKKNI